jgi:hypothetical protein
MGETKFVIYMIQPSFAHERKFISKLGTSLYLYLYIAPLHFAVASPVDWLVGLELEPEGFHVKKLLQFC